MKKIFLVLLIFTATTFANTQDETIKNIQAEMRQDLADGKIDQARNNLERASSNFHSVAIELGLIQTLMQAGEYTHALAAAAHTQAEHSDNTDARIFYAWLLAIGGHEKAALELTEKYADDDGVNLLHTQIQNHSLNPANIKISDAIQLAPFSKSIPTRFKYLQNGVLLADGIHAVTTRLKNFDPGSQLKVRNGLGEITEAVLDDNFESDTLSLLILREPIKIKLPQTIATTLIPGRPTYLISYYNELSWPQLKMDVISMPEGHSTAFKTHIQNTQPGSGLYNQAGQLNAITGENNLVINLTNALEFLKLTTTAKASPQIMDDIYQAALITSLQILGDAPP